MELVLKLLLLLKKVWLHFSIFAYKICDFLQLLLCLNFMLAVAFFVLEKLIHDFWIDLSNFFLDLGTMSLGDCFIEPVKHIFQLIYSFDKLVLLKHA